MVNNNQTIIIKRIKKVSGGAHGGAWKVAYADFVTAMMAFFLLLWLLNATEAENLAGLADYFAPTVGVKDEMGIGFRGGKAALSEGIGADKNTNKGIVFGGVPTGPITKVTQEILERTDQEKQEQIQVVINEMDTQKQGIDQADEMAGAATQPPSPLAQQEEKKEEKPSEEEKKMEQALQSAVEDLVKNRRIDEGSVEIKRTPEGLVIEIKDLSGNSMFEKDASTMKQKLKDSLVELSKILRNIPNSLAIIGHTSSEPVQGKAAGYTKWELSADRANATRGFLEKNGVQVEQFSRVEGRADNIPYDRRRPESSVNNRINIIILNKNDTPGHKKAAPDSLLIDLKGRKAVDFIEETEPKEEKKDEKKPAVEEKPVIPNEEAKKVMQEVEKTKIDAAKTPAATIVNEPKADIIDLNVDRKAAAPIVTPVNAQENQAIKNIFEESAKTKAEAAKAVSKPAAPKAPAAAPAEIEKDNGSNIIDFDKIERAPAPVVSPSDSNTNSEFQRILNETQKKK
jgi:chemotaxis protein MotB